LQAKNEKIALLNEVFNNSLNSKSASKIAEKDKTFGTSNVYIKNMKSANEPKKTTLSDILNGKSASKSNYG
jgi:hypothetical protein